MKSFIRTYYKTLLFFAVIGIFGGFFTGLFLLETYPPDVKAELISELNAVGLVEISPDMLLAIITAVQSAGYGFILGALGIFFGKKTGIWKDEKSIAKRPLIITGAFALAGGLIMILPDLLFFCNYSDVIKNSYAAKPTLTFILASVTYGAVIEEVMLRLFTMSFIAFILHKLFAKGKAKPQTLHFVAANVISALLFAIGHLPATFAMIGTSALLILRCILINGAFGLLFGYLYRKYGLRYSMLAHGGCHIVSKLIWILFL